jgi:5'-3' exonuclease
MPQNKYCLLDGNNLAHIAFHRAKSIVLKIKKKTDENAEIVEADYSSIESMMYHVFFLKLHKYFKKFNESYFIMCWDSGGSSAWRKEIYPEYKANRNYEIDPIWKILFKCISNLRGVLQSYPVTQESEEQLEADDIMYVLSKKLKPFGEVTIISGDSDMIQTAQEFGTKLFHPIKDKYIKAPVTYNYCLYKAIKGDTSDDIDGIYGYGPVKSAKLAEACEHNIDAIDVLNDDQKRIVERNLQLIKINNNPNLGKTKLDINKINASKNIDFQKIRKFYFDHKLKQLLEDFDYVVSVFN